jgi:thiamine-phosphate pyrophosphorylase
VSCCPGQAVLCVPDAPFLPCPSRLGLYAVVPTAEWVARLVELKVPTIQLRYKLRSGDSEDIARKEVLAAVAAAKGSDSRLFINDHWKIAIEAGAYGVHLGQEDLDDADLSAIQSAGLRLGVSTHGVEELDRALSVRPSYVAMGAIFPTTTKVLPTAPQGLEKLRHYVQQAGNTPSVAIGGIDRSNAKAVLATGVGTIAVVRAITEADDVSEAVSVLNAMIAERD